MDQIPEKKPLVPDDAPVESTIDDNGVETVVDSNGQKYEVVKGYTNHDTYTPAQQRVIGEIYIRMAQELPTEGRDYMVKFEFDKDATSPRLAFKPITQLGRDYIKHLASVMAKGEIHGRE